MYYFLMTKFDPNMLKGAIIYFLLAFGLVLFMVWYAKYALMYYFKLKKHGTKATAKITESKDGYVWLKYTAGEDIITKQSSIDGFSAKKYPVGASLDIYYDPEKPDKFVIKGHDIYMRIALAAVFGIFFGYMTALCFSEATVRIAQFLGYK